MTLSYRNASFPITSNRVGIGQSKAVGGMPAKFGPSSNGTGFASARQINLAKSFKPQQQLTNLDNSKSSFNYLGTKNSQNLQNGKPIPNNSSDLYISRKKNIAIAQSSTKQILETTRIISFKGSTKQSDIVQVRNRCRNQGCIPSKKVVNNRIQNSLGCC
jgi:hypothetical protein